MFFLTAAFVAYAAVLIATIVYALVHGGPHERSIAIAIILGVVATQIAGAIEAARTPQYGVMIVDATLVVAFFVVASRSTGYWPIWATAAQLVGTLTHIVVFVRPTISIELYASTQPFWVFPVLIALVSGVMTTRRSRRR